MENSTAVDGADTANSTEDTGTEVETAEDEGTEDKGTDEITKWKQLARKHERDAKANRAAAAKLAKIEEASKTAEQRAADALKAAEDRALEAEARVLRREVALEHKLSREDAEFLDGITDEDQMQALAKRLAKIAKDADKDDADDEPKTRAVRRKTPRMTGSQNQSQQDKAVAKSLFSGE